MKYSRTEIPDVIICDPKVLGDHRGYFIEAYKESSLTEFLGYKINFCQDNESSSSRGVLRGLHYQSGKHSQTKLVRVVQGCVIDIAVDCRKGSPTFGKHVAVELSSENKRQLLVPKGFAHGFIVLSDLAIFNYKVDAPYHVESEVGIAYNDPALGIDWKLDESEFILAEKDLKNPLLSEVELFDYNINYYE